MRGQLLRRVLIVAAALGVVASAWFLPRAVSSGASTPPASIELRSEPAPTASRDPAAQPQAVDDRGDDADDGDGARERNRAERRTSRESVPDIDSTRPADDDGDDDGGDDDGDDDDGDDDLGDDDD
jgi:hypothetical protein